MQYVYVASSWRNKYYPDVVEHLLAAGIDVYDFRHPAPDNNGFSWAEIDPNWKSWTGEQFTAALKHPVAIGGFELDEAALLGASVLVLVLPCGRSAHVEAGFAAGMFKYSCGAKKVLVYIPPGESIEPELMYSLFDGIVSGSNSAFALSTLAETIKQSPDWYPSNIPGRRVVIVRETHSYLQPMPMSSKDGRP